MSRDRAFTRYENSSYNKLITMLWRFDIINWNTEYNRMHHWNNIKKKRIIK